MNCRKAAALFSEHIEGRLDQERAERLLAHLDRCADCAELLEIMALNIVQMENTPHPPMPAGLEQRLAGIPHREPAATGVAQRAGGHWLFSNAAAAVILALFITANLTWFNPDFQDSIHGYRSMITDQSARVLALASDFNEGFSDLKRRVESRVEEVRGTGEQDVKDADQADENRSVYLVTEIIRALGLIGT